MINGNDMIHNTKHTIVFNKTKIYSVLCYSSPHASECLKKYKYPVSISEYMNAEFSNRCDILNTLISQVSTLKKW